MGETLGDPDNPIEGVSEEDLFQQLRDKALTVADADMVEAVQVIEGVGLVERPADRPTDDRNRVRESVLQVGADLLKVGAILV